MYFMNYVMRINMKIKTKEEALFVIKKETRRLDMTVKSFIEDVIGVSSSAFYEWKFKTIRAVNFWYNNLYAEHDEPVAPKEMEGEVERKQKVEIIKEGVYKVYYGKGEFIVVTEQVLQNIKRDYTIGRKEIGDICINYILTRKEFFAIKTAFEITHQSIPFTDNEMNTKTVEDLTDTALLEKKKRYIDLFAKKEISQMKSELIAYKTKEFWVDKVVAKEIKIDSVIKYETDVDHFRQDPDDVVFLPIADVHAGMCIDTKYNKYNLQVMKDRIKKLTYEVVKREGSKNKIVVAFLGDFLHGIIHTSTRLGSENVIDSYKALIEALAEMLINFRVNFNTVEVLSVNGNHDSLISEKTARTVEDNLGSMIIWNLEALVSGVQFIEQEHKKIGIHKIFDDLKICVLHGDEGGDLMKKTHHIDSDIKYLYTGHLHHEKISKHRWFQQPSFCGPDSYSLSKLLLDKPQTNFYVFNESGNIKLTHHIFYDNI